MVTWVPQRRRRRRLRVMLALGWYAAEIHHGVVRFAREADWVLNVDPLRSASVPATWGGDGIIAILGSNKRMDRQLLRKRVPVVNIGPAGPEAIPSTMPDNDAIARLAVEHFVTRGFRHYAYYLRSGGPGDLLRCKAFGTSLEAKGFSSHVIDWPARTQRRGKSDRARMQWLARSIAELPKPLAIYSEFDDRAVECLQACEIANITVPEQVAVLGTDNDELQCEFAPVPLSSIDDDQAEQGYQAAAILNEIMLGGAPPIRPMLIAPRGVVTRQSTDILAVDHPAVATAVRAVWEHYTEPISAGDIAQTVAMSARRLHDAFQKYVGHSIADELARKRVEHARDLLMKTDKKLFEVAALSGFSSADHLTKVFSRRLGISPSKFRRKSADSARG